MKVLVISDTHGQIDRVKRILEETIPFGVEKVLHCGDYVTDARMLQKFYPEVEVISVFGNCDVGFGSAYDEAVTIEGVSIYMTHGHRYGVKWEEFDELLIDTEAHECKVCVFGHTHCAYIAKKEGILLLNPGSITKPRDGYGPSYAILDLKDGKIKEVAIMECIDNQGVERHPAMNRQFFL